METLIERLRKRAGIRRTATGRKSVLNGEPDRIADLLEEAAQRIAELEKDAERLDWLLGTCDAQTSFYISGNECASAEELKDAIDKAMKGDNDG